MTAFERVRRTRRSLGVVAGSSALFWSAAMLFGLLAVGAALNAAVALPPAVVSSVPVIAALAAVATLVTLAWRSRFVWSFDKVALWIEERAPELRYALVTAVDPRYQGATAQLMDPAVSRVDTGAFVRTAARRSTLPAFLALAVTLGVFVALPKNWTVFDANGLHGMWKKSSPLVGNRLVPLSGTMTPPEYAHLKTKTLSDPTIISGLVGSRVVLTGHGAPDGIEAALEVIPPDEDINVPVGDTANDDSQDITSSQVPPSSSWSPSEGASGDRTALPGMGGSGMNGPGSGRGAPRHQDEVQNYNPMLGLPPEATASDTQKTQPERTSKKPYVRPAVGRRKEKAPIVKKLAVTAGGKGWIASFVLADSNPALLKLVDRQYHRTIVIDPRVDQPPTGRLLLPVRDTTYKTVAGTLTLSATFSDDIGLGKAQFEWIRCRSKAGAIDDDYDCKSGTYLTKDFSGAASGDFSFSAPLASLDLAEGDLLTVRAVAWDNNTVTGPGKGVTESRTIRIARKNEYKKLNVPATPPSADTAIQTLRMLIIAVGKLDTTYNVRHAMQRAPYEDSSQKLGGVGQGIQQKIDVIIDAQTGGGELPVPQLLGIARDSMFGAVRSLLVAETHEALPALWETLRALQEWSKAQKYLVRGQIEVPLINISNVRLKGKEPGLATPRTPRLMTDEDRDRYMQSYGAAVQQLRSSPGGAVDALMVLQVQTLRKYPNLASTIGDAIAAIRAKKDPGAPLARARRILEGGPGPLDSLPLWSGAW